jgi:hypothetical protein
MVTRTAEDKMKISIYNAETFETIERDATNQEVAQFKADAEFIEKIQAEHLNKKEQKLEIAEKLGLSAEELEILFG